MSEPAKPTCATCRYFAPGYFGDANACRRYPPSIATGTGPECPAVKREDWCGEYSPIVENKDEPVVRSIMIDLLRRIGPNGHCPIGHHCYSVGEKGVLATALAEAIQSRKPATPCA